MTDIENPADASRPLRILYVLPYVPSPIRVRPFQLIRSLAELGHDVTVAALEDGLADEDARAELRRVCRAVYIVPLPARTAAARALLSLPTGTPLWAAWCASPRMEALLRELSASGQFDIAHVEHLRAAHFATALGALPRVIDAVDCITALRRQMLEQRGGAADNRLLSWTEWRKLRRYEPRAYKAYRRIGVTSSHDAQALVALDPLLPPIDIIPNGVDLEYFTPTDAPPEADHLVFSGKMSYSANDDAARHLVGTILPRIRVRLPQRIIRLTIAGSGPSAALQREAARAGGVEVTGYVDDLRPFLSRASVSVSPMRIGVGIQNKVLEAMALARPVVCSTLAARALRAESFMGAEQAALGKSLPHTAVLTADDPNEFADGCMYLLERPEIAIAMGKRARKYVENYHIWKNAAKTFANVYYTVKLPQRS